MNKLIAFCVLFGLLEGGYGQYVLSQQYQGEAFFDGFSFQNISDPTNGAVIYVDQYTAWKSGYANVTGNSVYLGVDHTNVYSNGRESVRLQSNDQFTEALVVLHLSHMPGSICGTWPAFWTVGGNWPNEGEIDIIEGVNVNTQNQMTMHTSAGCSNDYSLPFTGEDSGMSSDCEGNTGCGIVESQANSYGTGFNNNGGGVFAMERTNASIQIWFFQPSEIPSDALGNSPNPSGWGTPSFALALDSNCPDYHFGPQNIIFNIDFCGDWAGSVWQYSCSSLGSSCSDYVNNNPGAFYESYFMIETLNVYTQQ